MAVVAGGRQVTLRVTRVARQNKKVTHTTTDIRHTDTLQQLLLGHHLVDFSFVVSYNCYN